MSLHTIEDMTIMTVSRNGQVSIPAEIRARWNTRKVIVVDLGGRVVIRPVPDDPIAEARGSLAGHGPSTDELRKRMREEDARDEARRL